MNNPLDAIVNIGTSIDADTKIAVVGVSHDQKKYGYRIFKDLLHAGYQVFAVNPKGGSIVDQQVYSKLQYVPKKPDLVVTVVPPRVTKEIVQQCLELEIPAVWMQPGSESQEAIDLAQDNNLQLTTQACLMKQHQIW